MGSFLLKWVFKMMLLIQSARFFIKSIAINVEITNFLIVFGVRTETIDTQI